MEINEITIQHDDGYHITSAKRDTNSGVAGLDASGQILAQGPSVFLKRDGSGDIHIYERITTEETLRIHRMAANQYIGYLNESGVFQQIQTASMKNVANGIMGLGATSKAAIPNLPVESPSGTTLLTDISFQTGLVGVANDGVAATMYTPSGAWNIQKTGVAGTLRLANGAISAMTVRKILNGTHTLTNPLAVSTNIDTAMAAGDLIVFHCVNPADGYMIGIQVMLSSIDGASKFYIRKV